MDFLHSFMFVLFACQMNCLGFAQVAAWLRKIIGMGMGKRLFNEMCPLIRVLASWHSVLDY